MVSWEEEDIVVFGMGGECVVPGVYGEGGPLGHPHVQANNSRHLVEELHIEIAKWRDEDCHLVFELDFPETRAIWW